MNDKDNLQREAQVLREQSQLNGETQRYRMWCDGTSPYSWKLRSYLDYKGIPWQRMRVNADIYFRKIPEKVGMSIIPVLLTPDDQVLQDSTPIMAMFEQQHAEPACIPTDPRLAFIMWLLEDFGDEYLPRFSMHYRWGNDQNRQTLSHRIARSMAYGSAELHPEQLAPIILERQSGFDRALGLVSEAARASLDQQLLDLLAILDRHFERYQFLLGDRPSLADFALYGHLYAHLFRDPFSAQIMEVHGARTCNWLETINELGDTRGLVGQASFGDWLVLDADVPDALQQLLGFVAKTYLPFSAGCARAAASKQKEYRVEIYGVETEFLTAQYRAWSFEQVQRRWHALVERERVELGALLAETGIMPAMMAGGIHHVNLFDDFTPPLVKDGIADARIRHLKGKAKPGR